MSDVLRVRRWPVVPDPEGNHALIPWEKYERLQLVADAVRHYLFDDGTLEELHVVLRELEDSDE